MLVSIAISVYGNLQTANLHTTTVIIFVILHRGWAKTHKKKLQGDDSLYADKHQGRAVNSYVKRMGREGRNE